MMVDRGVEDRREKASWLTTWFATAGLVSKDILASVSGVGVGEETRGGEERGDSVLVCCFRGDWGAVGIWRGANRSEATSL